MGIRDKPIAPRSPWQNGFAERLIGSIRRECLDHIVVFSEAHLRHLLRAYASYYNATRTHRSLEKDAPVHRPVQLVAQERPFRTLVERCSVSEGPPGGRAEVLRVNDGSCPRRASFLRLFRSP